MILMQPIDVYQMYCAMKAHFSKSSYNFIKYGGKTKVSRDSFWKRNDRYFFVKISKKYNNDEIKHYLLSNFIQNRNGYIANFNDQNYENWLDRKMMFYNIFQQELKPYIKNFEPLFEIKGGNHPTLLKEYLGKRVSLETMVILDELVDFSKKWDEQLGDDVVWPDIKNLMKNYKGFLTINKNKYRMKLLSLIEESS